MSTAATANRSQAYAVSRRTVLKSIVAAVLLSPGLASAQREELVIGACGSRDGRHFLGWVANGILKTVELPYRAHEVVAKPRQPGRVLALPRRPGVLACEVDLLRERVVSRFDVASARRFYGHGRFSPDGRYLFTTENDFERGRGVIGIRDGRDYRRVGELDSHGIGPHDLAFTPDGAALVVANGGIRTHPDSHRSKLNLDTMQPNLAYLDVDSDALLGRYTVPERHAGIRHLAVADDGTVALAMQFERAAAGHARVVPLAAVQRAGAEPTLLSEPTEAVAGLADYCGSVAVDSHHRTVVVTSPRGHSACFWHLDTGAFKARLPMPRVCGVALTASRQHFVLSNDLGELRYVRTDRCTEEARLRVEAGPWMWDNHLVALAS